MRSAKSRFFGANYAPQNDPLLKWCRPPRLGMTPPIDGVILSAAKDLLLVLAAPARAAAFHAAIAATVARHDRAADMAARRIPEIDDTLQRVRCVAFVQPAVFDRSRLPAASFQRRRNC